MVDCTIVPDGVKTGCLQRKTLLGAEFPVVSDVMGLLPREQWKDRLGISLRPHVPIIHYQNGEGSCAGNSSVLAGVEIPRSLTGLPFVHIAPSSLYKQSGGGRDAGSGLDENLRCLKNVGCVPVEMWGGELGWNKSYPAGFEKEAAKYQVDEWFDLGTFEEFMSALFYGFPISFGVFWGRGGHAICAVEPIHENGEWGCVFANSWGLNWGDGGFGKMFEPQITRGIEYFGGWAARVATYSKGVVMQGLTDYSQDGPADGVEWGELSRRPLGTRIVREC